MRAPPLAAVLVVLASGRAGGSIYGADDRVELREITNARLKEAARGVAALVETKNVRAMGSAVRLTSTKYGPTHHLASSARFYDQPTAAYCTGALVAPDVVLTAGHCFKNCPDAVFVFDYADDGAGRDPSEPRAESVFACKKVLKRVGPKTLGKDVDWALVRLDRPAAGRPLLRFAASAPIPGAEIAMLGFPSGLPLKATKGYARGDVDSVMWRAAIGSFTGSSGSPVFDAKSLEVVGLLIDGPDDFVQDPATGDNKLLVLPDDGAHGEVALKPERFVSDVRAALSGQPEP